MLQALKHIHNIKPPVIHRDIKPPNILFRKNNFFLADFGFAKTVDTNNTGVGTPFYIPPEALYGGAQTTKMDIYSLAVSAIECFTQFPTHMAPVQFIQNWPAWHQFILEVAKDKDQTLVQMLAESPHERPNASTLYVALGDEQRTESTPNPSSRSNPRRSVKGKERMSTRSTATGASEWTERLRATPERASRARSIQGYNGGVMMGVNTHL